MDTLWLDLRQAFRVLAKNPGFVCVCMLVLALGVGANTAIFSIVNAAFFRPLPVVAPGELMYLYVIYLPGKPPIGMPYRDYQFFRDHNEAFADLTFHGGAYGSLSADGETETVRGESVTANYFDLLGIKPYIGRTFLPEDDDPSNTQLSVVISHKLWERRFKSDPGVVGKQVRLSDATFTVVGVTKPGFEGVSGPWSPSQFWVTLVQWFPSDYRRVGISPIGRLKPDVTPRQAQTIIANQGEQLRQSHPYASKDRYIALSARQVSLPFDPNATFVPERLAAALMVVVGMVLLIAAANIAGILMARVVTRRSEIAVRHALGAGRLRIMRQLLTESFVLSILGGLVGLWLARILLSLFSAYTPERYSMDIAMDARVVLFAALVCIAAGVISGAGPALRATRIDGAAALGGPGIAGSKQSRLRLRHWIVVPQVALSLVLLIVAGLFVRTLMNLEFSYLGYETRDSIVLGLRLGEPRPARSLFAPAADAEKQAERLRASYRRLVEGVQSLPEARQVAIASTLPLTASPGFERFFRVIAEDDYLRGGREGVGNLSASVSPGYFRIMGISLLSGRDFDERDRTPAPRVAIISSGLAQRLWPGMDPLGRLISFYKPNVPDQKLEWMRVVGIAGEVSPVLHDIGETPFAYVPLAQEWRPSANLIVARGRGDLSPLVARLKNVVAASDVFAEVVSVRTMNQNVAEILYPRRMAAGILAVSGFIGLLIASVGIYGVISYSVAQRVREIGIRAALGARRGDIMRLVIREGIGVACLGSVLGMALAYAVVRIVSRLFASVPALDSLTSISASLFLAVVILFACLIPARRATRVDPAEILKGP